MKFRYGDMVKVTNGFFKGRVGKCVDTVERHEGFFYPRTRIEYMVELRMFSWEFIREEDLELYQEIEITKQKGKTQIISIEDGSPKEVDELRQKLLKAVEEHRKIVIFNRRVSVVNV